MGNSVDPARYKRRASRERHFSRLTYAVAWLFCFTVPFDPIALFAGRSAPFLAGSALVILVVLERAFGTKMYGAKQGTLLLLSAYVTWVAVSNYWTLDAVVSQAATAQVLARAAFLLALVTIFPLAPRLFFSAYALGAASLALLLLAFGEEEFADRSTLMGADQNFIGLGISVGLGIALSMCISTKGSRKAYWLVPILMMSWGVLETGSRGAFVACLVAGFSLLAIRASVSRLFQSLALLAVGWIFLSWARSQQMLPTRIELLMDRVDTGPNVRLEIARQVLTNPEWMTWGVGIHADAQYLFLITGQGHFVHNLWLGVWVNLGLIGIALFVALWIHAARSARQSPMFAIWATAAVTGLTCSLFLPGQTSNVYWFLLATGVSLAKPMQKVGEESPSQRTMIVPTLKVQ